MDLEGEHEPMPEPRGSAGADVSALRKAWLGMRSLQDLDKLLDRFQMTEVQVLGLLGNELAFRVPVATLESILAACVDFALPITVVVGDRKVRRTRSGPVARVERTGPALTLSGPKFTLRICDARADSAWIVRRPFATVTRFELYAPNGAQVATICGAREEGARVAWAILISTFAEGSFD
jgi:putative heme degradation protein